jgi:hypothetical protein
MFSYSEAVQTLKVKEALSVATIDNHLLAGHREVADVRLGNLQVGMGVWKESVGPHNPTHLKYDSPLIPNCWPIQLVRLPLRVEWPRLLDGAVGAIESDVSPASLLNQSCSAKLICIRGSRWLVAASCPCRK